MRTQFTTGFTTPLPQGPYGTVNYDAWADYYAGQVAAGRVGMQTITKDDNGKTITLGVGDKIEIVLPVINDGEWDEKGRRGTETPPSWESGVIQENYTPVNFNSSSSVFIPSNDGGILQIDYYNEVKEVPVKTYETVGIGEFELVLEYFSWSNPDVILDTFSVLIKVE